MSKAEEDYAEFARAAAQFQRSMAHLGNRFGGMALMGLAMDNDYPAASKRLAQLTPEQRHQVAIAADSLQAWAWPGK